MITFEEVLALVEPLKAEELNLWIARQWVRPERRGGQIRFADIDVARVRMIYDIRYTLDVAPDTVPVMLSLIDQLYTMRRQMRGVMHALETLSPEARKTVMASLEKETKDTGKA